MRIMGDYVFRLLTGCLFFVCAKCNVVTSLNTVHYAQIVLAPHDDGVTMVTEVNSIFMDLSVQDCTSECMYMPVCDFVNYHYGSRVCYIIRHVNATREVRISVQPNYVLGKKAEWTQVNTAGCESCSLTEKCDVNSGSPSCKTISCGPPPPQDNAIVTGNRHTIGSYVSITCIAEDDTHLHKTATCLSNGTWTNTSLDCKQVPTTTTTTTTTMTTPVPPSFSCHGTTSSFKTVTLGDGSHFTYRLFGTRGDNVEFDQANSNCEYFGGRLAKVSTDAKFDMVSALVQCAAFDGEDYWVNVRRIDSVYQSLDGDLMPSGDKYWAEYSGECARIEGSSGKLNSRSCIGKERFICEL